MKQHYEWDFVPHDGEDLYFCLNTEWTPENSVRNQFEKPTSLNVKLRPGKHFGLFIYGLFVGLFIYFTLLCFPKDLKW